MPVTVSTSFKHESLHFLTAEMYQKKHKVSSLIVNHRKMNVYSPLYVDISSHDTRL